MQKHILSIRNFLCLLYFIIAHDHFSQTNINYQWCKGVGGIGSDVGKCVQIDASGNVYIAGCYSNTVDFDPGPGTAYRNSSGNADAFIAKYDANGNYLWAISFGDWADDRINSLALDALGNVYVTGRFSHTVDFDYGIGNAMFTASGGWGMFLAKYDTNGNYVWARGFGGGNGMEGTQITLDINNNCIVTGNKWATYDLDPGPGVANVNQISTVDCFLAKYDNNGNYILAFGLGGSVANSSVAGTQVVTDPSGDIYLAGFFTKLTDFDPAAGTSTLNSVNGADVFFAKYDANGNYQWAKSFGSGNDDYCHGLTLDGLGNICMAGRLYGPTDYDTGPGTAILNPVGLYDIFVAKYDASGNYIWAFGAGGTNYESPTSIRTDNLNNIYITGGFMGTVDMDPAMPLALLYSAGAYDIFIAKYNASGIYQWAYGMGSANNDSGADINLDGAGNLYLTGYYGGNTDFDPNTSTAMVNWIASDDVFFAKYVVTPTGITEHDFTNTLDVFPNPASGVFNVKLPLDNKKWRIEICNTLGEIVAKHNLSEEINTIDVSEVAKGIYVYRIISESDVNGSNGKLIVD